MRRSLLLVAVVLATAATPAHAGTVTVSGGAVTYNETDLNARNIVTIALSGDGSRITVSDSGRSGSGSALRLTSDGSCTASRATASCPAGGVGSITVSTTGQNDTITQNASLPSRLDGGDGNDKITGGPGDDDLIGGAGADTLAGGAGHDSADYSARLNPVNVSLDGAANDGEVGESDNVGSDVEAIVGGAGNDTLTGNDADNALLGNAGNDTLTAAGGNDQLDGGAGDDTLDGGTGSDSVAGGDGFDSASYIDSPVGVRVVLDGKPGDGAPGENDSVDTEGVAGSPFDDVLIGNAGNNLIQGADGNDHILGGAGADALYGNHGDDVIQALDGEVDQVFCGEGQDGTAGDRGDVRTDCEYIKYRTVASSATALHLSKGTVRAPVRCSPATAEGCHGRISLKAGRHTLGSLTYRLASGRRWVAKIKLTRRGLATVRRHRVTTASLVVRETDETGTAVTTTQTVRIGH